MDTVVFGLAVLTVIGGFLGLLILVALLVERGTGRTSPIVSWTSAHGLWLLLVVTLIATLGSLFLSEIVGWAPCKYCWIQRIFMYPQLVLLIVALLTRDRSVAKYLLALAVLGGLYAAYHYYIQMYDIVAAPTNPATPCDMTGESCVKTPFVFFGYVTIPMMALTAFVLSILGSISMLRRKH